MPGDAALRRKVAAVGTAGTALSDGTAGRWLRATPLAAWFALMPAQVPAQDATGYADRAGALVEPYLEAGLFSGAVLVAKDGHPVFRRAFGPANREWDVANTPDTQFRIGSLTKAFTAAAILQLAERGKLDLDDPIGRTYAGAPAAWDRVSLRMLLQHSSGIINFTALPDYHDWISRLETTPRAIVALTEHEPLLFEPGTRFEYTNTGYMLLGLAIEAASGQPYAQYLRERILGPLGLKVTDYDDQSTILPRRAAGYRFGGGRWRNAAPMASSVAYAAGGMRSTVDDLLAWDEALLGGAILSPASRDLMFRDGGFGYGLGWFIGTAKTGDATPRRLWSHGGNVPGFLAISDLYPDEHLAVIVLANTETAPVQKLSRELAALWFGTFDSPDEIALEDVILDRYVGQYRLGPRTVMSVGRDGRRLRAQGTGEPPYTFIPESARTFVSPVTGARITFDTEPDGHPTGLILHRDGRDRIGPRIDGDEAAAPSRAP